MTDLDSAAREAVEELRYVLDDGDGADTENDYYSDVREPIEVIIKQLYSYHRACVAAYRQKQNTEADDLVQDRQMGRSSGEAVNESPQRSNDGSNPSGFGHSSAADRKAALDAINKAEQDSITQGSYGFCDTEIADEVYGHFSTIKDALRVAEDKKPQMNAECVDAYNQERLRCIVFNHFKGRLSLEECNGLSDVLCITKFLTAPDGPQDLLKALKSAKRTGPGGQCAQIQSINKAFNDGIEMAISIIKGGK